MADPSRFLITASRPPSMLARALVGVTQASTFWSSIEPCTTSTSASSSKVARHALIIWGLMSTSTTFTGIGLLLPARWPGLGPGRRRPGPVSGRELDEVLDPLLTDVVDDILV